jgi:hypothetical protein
VPRSAPGHERVAGGPADDLAANAAFREEVLSEADCAKKYTAPDR